MRFLLGASGAERLCALGAMGRRFCAPLNFTVRESGRALLLAVVIVVPIATWGDDLSAVAPPCANPSRLEGKLDATTPDVTVRLKHDTTNAPAVALTLANKYGVTVAWDGHYQVPQSGRPIPPLTADKIAQLRCEPGVDLVVVKQPEPAIFP